MKNPNFTELQLMIFEKERVECDDVAVLLGDLCDNELPPSLKGRVEAHIRECDYCQEMERGYRMTIELAHELRQESIPVDVQNRLRKGLNAKLGLTLAMIEE